LIIFKPLYFDITIFSLSKMFYKENPAQISTGFFDRSKILRIYKSFDMFKTLWMLILLSNHRQSIVNARLASGEALHCNGLHTKAKKA